MSMLNNIEQVLKTQYDAYIKTLIKRYGITIRVFEAAQTESTSIYGKSAGEVKTTASGEFDVLMTGDDFFSQDNRAAGAFQSGFLVTDNPLVKSGATIELVRDDAKFKKYKVKERQGIGQTKTVFTRYEISALG